MLVQAIGLLVTFENVLNNKKIPCITPLFHNNKFISNFRDKAELFTNLFARQCALIAMQLKLCNTQYKNNQNPFISPSYESRYCQNNIKP